MKYDPKENWRTKIERINRLAQNISAGKKPFDPPEMTDEMRAGVEDVTRYERLRGQILKFKGRRPRVM